MKWAEVRWQDLVVAAAVVMPEDFNVPGIDDSKKLSEKKREEMFDVIKQHAVCTGIGMAEHEVIDEINILQATKQAMACAIEDLRRDFAERYPDRAAAGEGPDYVILRCRTPGQSGSATGIGDKG